MNAMQCQHETVVWICEICPRSQGGIGPEPSPLGFQAIAIRAAAEVRAAVRAAREAGVTLTPDADGAWLLWEYAAAPPFKQGTRCDDVYMDAWYEAAYDELVGAAITAG